MNTAIDVLTYAKQHHIHLEFNGEKIVMEAARNLLTEKFISDVKEHKTELIRVLTTSEPEINIGLSAEDELKIRRCFTAINETDPAFIAELLENCRKDPKLIEHFLELANGSATIVVPTGGEPWEA